ncbi:ligand-binding sensor domain-containing protein [Xanthomarina sp. F2636L]|uniref:ligand-binding sensor domain-containing protein n=1 Tax=Xanthomarina sp. F2636L TaxID=2996018 RepID=UPI00225E4705|nr:two-component regulator propeller domain-containing protein [Xanthomarina sp. F2636L]MCX7549414.1 triple tyrosine motif-containing protein [Xanthomarina sp. F2636L]
MKAYFNKKILFIFCLLSVQFAFSQKFILQDTIHGNYIGQKQGLLQLNVKSITLDDMDYLWAGTEDGLHKYNGYDFKYYLNNPEDSTSIEDDHIRDLYFVRDTLWFATNSKGINGYIPSKNRFFKLIKDPRLNHLNTAYNIFELSNKYVLFAVKNHAIIFNRHTKSIKRIALPNSQLETYITDALSLNDNTFWLGTSTSGILKLDLETLEISNEKLLTDNNDIIFLSHQNQIYIGTKQGLLIYNTHTKKFTETPLKVSVNCFYKLNNNTFYIGSEIGLYIFNYKKNTMTPIVIKTQNNDVLKTIEINKIIADNKGNVWIATDGNGLIHYNTYQKKFETLKIALSEYPNLDNANPFQFLKGKDSTLWIGSKYGLVKYSYLTNKFHLYKTTKDQLIYTITKDENNTVWTGGFTTGLLKYDIDQDQFLKISGLPDDDVIDIIPIDKNTLWVSTWSGGIHEYNILEDTFKEKLIEDKRLNRARTSLVDNQGNIWLGTDEGVYKIAEDKSVTRYHENDQTNREITSNRIFSIKEDNDNNIWIGTSTGLTKLDVNTNTTTLYRKQKGLPNDFIYTILINNQDIWVSTNYGLSVLNTITNSFTNYTASDGLQNNEFNGKAALKDDFGNFYFGGISGINVFNPNKIKQNPFVPKTYIESVDLFNTPILKNEIFKDTLKFESHENVITFNYAALNYLNSEKCNYTYKMEGFDLDWRPITKNRSTTYTNLDPGTYTFKVKASNDAGVWNESPVKLTLIIIPPWYKTWVFRIIVILILLLSVPLLYKYKTEKLKSNNLKLERLVYERTQEISQKNKDLETAYNQADEQRKNIKFLMRELTHRVKNNLQIISSLLNIQANSIDNDLAINALKVSKNRILTISQIENKIANEKEKIDLNTFIRDISNSVISALSDDENLKFKVVYNLQKIAIKNVDTTLVGLILNELITNTTKYAFDDFNPENRLHISCSKKDKIIELVIKDNGKGYDKTKIKHKKSLGLELVSEMVDQLKGTIFINSNNGTEIILNIPI